MEAARGGACRHGAVVRRTKGVTRSWRSSSTGRALGGPFSFLLQCQWDISPTDMIEVFLKNTKNRMSVH
jgi:hypothetical protein